MTERLLHQAFERQRFAPNNRLQAVIDSAHARMAERELTDDELDRVVAAGVPEPSPQPKEPRP